MNGAMHSSIYDVIIIGAGIIGVFTARELSRYRLKVLVLDQESDLSEGTTKANSGIIHAGFDCEPGTGKARFNVAGSKMYEQLARELDFPYRQNGALVLAFTEQQEKTLLTLYEKGRRNGVGDLEILTAEAVRQMESNVSGSVKKAMYAPGSGIVSPYKVCIAAAENAAVNGAYFVFNEKVIQITKCGADGMEGYRIKTDNGEYLARTVVNAAGVYSDEINNLISEKKYRLVPRKGEYHLFDRAMDGYVKRTIFQLPGELGKGILVTPTIDGNLMIGPSAENIEDKQDLATHAEILKKVAAKAALSVPELPMNRLITSFSGLRAHNPEEYDFIVEEADGCRGFINAVGIDSPGLSAAPAIGKSIAELIAGILQPEENSEFIGERTGILEFRKLDLAQQNRLISINPAYGRIVCRCESITEAEVIDAIKCPLGASTIDGIKRRVRAGFGRCQGGFCTSRLLEILAREKQIKVSQVTKSGGGSQIIPDDGGEERISS